MLMSYFGKWVMLLMLFLLFWKLCSGRYHCNQNTLRHFWWREGERKPPQLSEAGQGGGCSMLLMLLMLFCFSWSWWRMFYVVDVIDVILFSLIWPGWRMFYFVDVIDVILFSLIWPGWRMFYVVDVIDVILFSWSGWRMFYVVDVIDVILFSLIWSWWRMFIVFVWIVITVVLCSSCTTAYSQDHTVVPRSHDHIRTLGWLRNQIF